MQRGRERERERERKRGREKEREREREGGRERERVTETETERIVKQRYGVKILNVKANRVSHLSPTDIHIPHACTCTCTCSGHVVEGISGQECM